MPESHLFWRWHTILQTLHSNPCHGPNQEASISALLVVFVGQIHIGDPIPTRQLHIDPDNFLRKHLLPHFTPSFGRMTEHVVPTAAKLLLPEALRAPPDVGAKDHRPGDGGEKPRERACELQLLRLEEEVEHGGNVNRGDMPAERREARQRGQRRGRGGHNFRGGRQWSRRLDERRVECVSCEESDWEGFGCGAEEFVAQIPKG